MQSAPVSRENTRTVAFSDDRTNSSGHDDGGDVSPPSSGKTAVNGNSINESSGRLFVRDAAAAAPSANRHNLGSASAPSSPGALGRGGHDFKSSEFPLEGISSTHHDDGAIGLSTSPSAPQVIQHPDPAVAAGLIHPDDSEARMPHPTSLRRGDTSAGASIAGGESIVGPDGIRRRDHHHHHHRSGRNTPSSYDPYMFAAGPWSRPSHQNSKHSQPVFSLARPLPTKEQRDAQKAYRESVRANAAHRAAGGRGAHEHAPAAPLVGPGAHHPHAAGGAMIGPGAHHGSYYGSPYQNQSYHGSHASIQPMGMGAQDHAQLMAMLRQLLAEQKNEGKKSENDDVREDQALARKEGFGDDKGNKDERTATRTARAERSDSLSSGSSTSSYSTDSDETFPNPWARFRHTMREPFAEFFGTYILLLFGTGVALQYFLTLDPNVASSTYGTYTNVSLGWGIGVALGVWVAGGISGGHLNPAVTLSLAVFRGFPWRKVPGYALAQLLGAMAAAGTTYGLYRDSIDIFEGGRGIRTYEGPTATASLFSTYPQAQVSAAAAWFTEFVDTAILLMVVLAISDINNSSPPDGLNPLVLFFVIVGLGACLGLNTAYCLNPARDLGPRMMTAMAGYGRGVFTFRNGYFFWCAILAPVCGALFGSFLYDAFIYTGSESPLNRKWEFPWQNKKREEFGPASKEKMPAGQTEP